MASVLQKYFMVSGIDILHSSQIWKKLSIVILLVNITAVNDRTSTFWLLNSFAETPTIFINGIKSADTLCLVSTSVNGDLSGEAGAGWEIRILEIFKAVLKLYLYFIIVLIL